MNMEISRTRAWPWLAATVVAHFAISTVHGAAHAAAHVPLSAAATLFVFSVILAGPLAGLALSWFSERAGSWVIAGTMAGALMFGLVNHFVLSSPDHVSQVATAWRPLFSVTAALLAVTELLGLGLAFSVAREGRTWS